MTHLLADPALPPAAREEFAWRLNLRALAKLAPPPGRADARHREHLRVLAEATPLNVACLFCAWRKEGLRLSAARVAFAAHECAAAEAA